MNYLTRHWTTDPTLFVVALTVVAHEIGLSRLRRHSAPQRSRRRRRHSYFFYAGLVVFVLAILSPLDYWASSYFFVHMLQHIVLSFAAPVLIVAGAPWIPLMFALPVGPRRRVGRFFYLSSRARGFRAMGRTVRTPWFALVSFNAAMLLWHIPSWFELSERNSFVHIALMHGSFMVTGILFWLQIIPSYPMKPAQSPLWQAGLIIISNAVMTVLAISMSILTAVSWYPNYSHLRGVTLAPFADQQIGAAILWVCGDFWALPALFIVVRRAIDNEISFTAIIDRLTGRGAPISVDAFRQSRAARPPVEGHEVASES